jgi:hypothetical protein
MSVARLPFDSAVISISLEEIMDRYIGRFRDKTPARGSTVLSWS